MRRVETLLRRYPYRTLVVYGVVAFGALWAVGDIYGVHHPGLALAVVYVAGLIFGAGHITKYGGK